MRLVAWSIGVAMLLLAVLAWIGASERRWLALAAAATVTMTSNGLAFTAVAERAGSRWAGRALGIQNTFQNVIATLVPTPLALLIGAAGGGAAGYALAFGAVVAFPFVAATLIPVRGEAPSERSISPSATRQLSRDWPQIWTGTLSGSGRTASRRCGGSELPSDVRGSRVDRIDGVNHLGPAECIERPVDRRCGALDGIALAPRLARQAQPTSVPGQPIGIHGPRRPTHRPLAFSTTENMLKPLIVHAPATAHMVRQTMAGV